MKRPIAPGASRAYRLPQIVGRGSLGRIARDINRSGRQEEILLDFSCVRHIDFRAFRGFVAGLRNLADTPGPILLVGLSPYCQEILRFALRPRDWELFEELFMEIGTPRGNGVPGTEWMEGRSLGPWVDALAERWAPCPN